MSAPIRVGIVGANAQRGWARDAHLSALQSLPKDYTIIAVSARNAETAEQACAAFSAQRAFADSLALVRDPGIDLVSVCVKVPEHRAIVIAALAAGKHVYCEWPLGRDLAEACQMAAAVPPGRQVAIGLQGLLAPAVRQAVDLVSNGNIGRPMVLRVYSPTAGWGAETPDCYTYLQDRRNGATLATIAGGHTLAMLEALVGPIIEVDARSSILHSKVRIQGTDRSVKRTCADHLMVLSRHSSGCVSTLEVAGGVHDQSFRLELIGDQGWLKVTGGGAGGFQVGKLRLETSFVSAPLPASVTPSLVGPPAHVAETYARLRDDIRSRTHTVPNFETAVQLSRLLAAIDEAADQGRRQRVRIGDFAGS